MPSELGWRMAPSASGMLEGVWRCSWTSGMSLTTTACLIVWLKLRLARNRWLFTIFYCGLAIFSLGWALEVRLFSWVQVGGLKELYAPDFPQLRWLVTLLDTVATAEFVWNFFPLRVASFRLITVDSWKLVLNKFLHPSRLGNLAYFIEVVICTWCFKLLTFGYLARLQGIVVCNWFFALTCSCAYLRTNKLTPFNRPSHQVSNLHLTAPLRGMHSLGGVAFSSTGIEFPSSPQYCMAPVAICNFSFNLMFKNDIDIISFLIHQVG